MSVGAAPSARLSAWTVVSLVCAAVIVLAFLIGSAYHSRAVAEAAALDDHRPPLGGAAIVALTWLIASPIGVIAGGIGWVRSAHRRWLASAGVLACAAPWLVMLLAVKLELVDAAPNCGCAELEEEE